MRKFWRRMVDVFQAGFAGSNPVTWRCARALEAEVLRERAEAVRLRGELDRLGADVTRQREEIVRERAEVARERAENERLRAENRALLNSILGIAGIPPIIVSATARGDIATPRRGDVAEALPDIATMPEKPTDEKPLESVAGIFEGGAMNANSLPQRERPESPAPRNPLFGALHVPDESREATEIPKAAPNPLNTGHGRTRFRRGVQFGGGRQSVTHTRRRSWQQINRMLEFESARKTVSGE